ncbi:hypothetical protein C8J56DRAFT_916982 [Mycena floridula]|nr:hypothetical protein C8J56DRAFT_916982 [Mycena floridula]
MHLGSLHFALLPVLQVLASSFEQIPIMQAPAFDPKVDHKPTVADLLTIEPSASIFYSYARELPLVDIFSQLNSNLTLLVPTNKAVMALSRKPHQGPSSPPSDIEISEEDFDKLSKQNVERWVSVHIIPGAQTSLEPRTYETMLDGRSVTFSTVKGGKKDAPQWSKFTLESGIALLNMKEASNGVIYMIDGTVTVD